MGTVALQCVAKRHPRRHARRRTTRQRFLKQQFQTTVPVRQLLEKKMFKIKSLYDSESNEALRQCIRGKFPRSRIVDNPVHMSGVCNSSAHKGSHDSRAAGVHKRDNNLSKCALLLDGTTPSSRDRAKLTGRRSM